MCEKHGQRGTDGDRCFRGISEYATPLSLYCWRCFVQVRDKHIKATGGGVCAVMLVSHYGEYMANGLTNAVRHEFVTIANDRQTFVAVRKHSRSFLWCFEGLRMQFAINSQ